MSGAKLPNPYHLRGADGTSGACDPTGLGAEMKPASPNTIAAAVDAPIAPVSQDVHHRRRATDQRCSA